MRSETYSTLNEERIASEQIDFAVDHCLKVSLQITDTPEFEFVIFHPYALLNDLFDGPSVIGCIERNHSGFSTNQMVRIKLSTVTFVEILPVRFKPSLDRWKLFETGMEYEYITHS
jgi:hypothetical protein